MMSLCNRPTRTRLQQFDLYSDNSPKQVCGQTCRLEHINLIPGQPSLKYCVLSREAANTDLSLWFDPTRAQTQSIALGTSTLTITPPMQLVRFGNSIQGLVSVMVFNDTSTIFQLYRGSQFYWWWKPEYQEKTTNLLQVILICKVHFIPRYYLNQLLVLRTSNQFK